MEQQWQWTWRGFRLEREQLCLREGACSLLLCQFGLMWFHTELCTVWLANAEIRFDHEMFLKADPDVCGWQHPISTKWICYLSVVLWNMWAYLFSYKKSQTSCFPVLLAFIHCSPKKNNRTSHLCKCPKITYIYVQEPSSGCSNYDERKGSNQMTFIYSDKVYEERRPGWMDGATKHQTLTPNLEPKLLSKYHDFVHPMSGYYCNHNNSKPGLLT